MVKLGKRQCARIDMAQTRGYCVCKCSCGLLQIKENAQNAAPTWMAETLIEPMGV